MYICKISSQEHPSSDSFYDSDGDGGSDLTAVERSGKNVAQEEEIASEERQRHDSSEVDGMWSFEYINTNIIIWNLFFISVCV